MVIWNLVPLNRIEFCIRGVIWSKIVIIFRIIIDLAMFGRLFAINDLKHLKKEVMRNTLIVVGIILLIFWVIGLIFKVIGVAINALLVIGLFLIVLSLI